MYAPAADVIAQAFDLGHPSSELIHVRSGDTDTWRLETTEGVYFVKGYHATTGGQFVAGGLLDQLEFAMDFERRAFSAGVAMPTPIPPVDPLTGWLADINGRLFRVYRWIPHRAVGTDDDIADWLGETMARVHQLKPLGRAGLPNWWRGPLWPRATWEEWFAEGGRRGKTWSSLGFATLPAILDIASRIEKLCGTAPDLVTTHGDFKSHNMVMATTGPVLVDWDSVRTDSAALEAGRVAHIFSAGEIAPIHRILAAYSTAGGDIGWADRDLFLSVERHDLAGLHARIQASLGQTPITWWMGSSSDVERTITEVLRNLPGKIDDLARLASMVSRL